MLLPLAAYLELQVFPGHDLVLPVFVFSVLLVLTLELVSWDARLPSLFTRRSLVGLGALLYPGFLMTYPMRFIGFQDLIPVTLLFLLLNFGNDTFAYIFGMLFGRYSIRIVPISPKKTLIGFIGGFAGALGIGGVFFLCTPSLFTHSFLITAPFFLLIGLCADIGDLIESAFKRAASMKDSGKLMPGRGGLMDSLDSLLFSAPFFYYIGTVLLN
jgi:phosphatidate cytidylyltransferase